MAKEVLLDTMHCNFWWGNGKPSDYWTWTPVGPGALRGVSRVQSYDGQLRNKYKEIQALDIILQLLSKQVEFWKWHKEKPLAPTDIQFQLCEFDKYERVRLGEGRPRAKYRREE